MTKRNNQSRPKRKPSSPPAKRSADSAGWASRDVADSHSSSQTSDSDTSPAKPSFVEALKSYFGGSSKNTFQTSRVHGAISAAERSKQTAPEKKVRLKQRDGLLMLLSHYVSLSRKGLTGAKQSDRPARLSAPTVEVEKRTASPSLDSDALEEAPAETKQAHRGLTNASTELDLNGTMFADNEALLPDAPDINLSDGEFDESMNIDLNAEELYVDIPEDMVVDAGELEALTQTISAEEIEDAAQFLGVFEGTVNLDKFQDYMPEEEVQAREAAKTAAASGGGAGFSLGQLKAMFVQQRELLAKLKQLTAALPKLTAASKQADKAPADAPVADAEVATAEVPTEAATVTDAVASDVSPVAEAETPEVAEDTAPTEETAEEVDEAALRQQMEAEGFLEPGQEEVAEAAEETPTETAEAASVAEEVGETDLGMEIAAPAEQPAEPESAPTTEPEPKKRGFSLFRRRAKETGEAAAEKELAKAREQAKKEADKAEAKAAKLAAKEAKKSAKKGFSLFRRKPAEPEAPVEAPVEAAKPELLDTDDMVVTEESAEPAPEVAAEAQPEPAAEDKSLNIEMTAAAPRKLSEKELKSAMTEEGFLESASKPEATAEATESEPKKRGFSLFGRKKSAAKEPKSENALREEMADEDFLESTQKRDTNDDVSLADLEGSAGAVEQPTEKLSGRELRAIKRQKRREEKENRQREQQETKKKKDEEKQWAEEAKRREKQLEQQRKQREQQAKQLQKKGQKVEIKMPKQKKVGSLQGFFMSLNYMGMDKDRSAFVENLGVMMDAGLPLLDALRALQMETKNKQMKKLLTRMVVAVETGSSLWRAMEAQYFFHPQQVAMVRVGEEAGNLVENLHYLTEQDAKERSLRSKVKTAMIYPIIIFVMLTAIVLGLGMFVLPNLIQVIFSLGVPLPFVTRMIILFTNFFTDHGATAVPGGMGALLVLLILHKYTSFKIVTQWIMYKIPGIGVLIREATLSQFGVTMGGLMQAGVPITDALESVADVATLVRYKKFYYVLLEHVKLGDSFTTSFQKIKATDKCFPTSMQQLIRTGEKSGSLTDIMMKIADIHDKKASDVAEKLPVILEPMLLLFIGSLVGTIALGILAPIYSVVGNVGN